MVIGYGAFYSQYTGYFVMAGLGRHIVFGSMIIALSFLNIIMGIGFLKYTDWGLFGLAVGTCLPIFLGSIFIIPVYTCNALSVPLRQYVREAFATPAMVTLPFLITCAAAVFLGTGYPIITLITLLIIGGLVFGTSLWNFGLNDAERSNLTTWRRRGLPFLFPSADQSAK
jgi:hypothetical protein